MESITLKTPSMSKATQKHSSQLFGAQIPLRDVASSAGMPSRQRTKAIPFMREEEGQI
jgi:hypothetical protein